jgi:hypothetical protein
MPRGGESSGWAYNRARLRSPLRTSPLLHDRHSRRHGRSVPPQRTPPTIRPYWVCHAHRRSSAGGRMAPDANGRDPARDGEPFARDGCCPERPSGRGTGASRSVSAIVARPSYPVLRYHGVLVPRSSWRRDIVPYRPLVNHMSAKPGRTIRRTQCHSGARRSRASSSRRLGYRPLGSTGSTQSLRMSCPTGTSNRIRRLRCRPMHSHSGRTRQRRRPHGGRGTEVPRAR